MNEQLRSELRAIVGPAGFVSDPVALEPHLTEWRGTYRGQTPALLLPDSTEAVARIVRACARAETPIVPQGGNTGLSGGAIPDSSGTQVIVGMSRMNRIRSVDPDDFSMIAEAGCTLAALQETARQHQRLFPLSLAAEGSCQIGGNLSTNAGGTNVLRYGTARAQALGLEVVLPSGEVWDGLRTLRKDTAGYDLKQLFIGAEGTLGIITAASLKLFARPPASEVAFIAVDSADAAVALFGQLREQLGEALQAFEYVSDFALELVIRHIPATARPCERSIGGYVLIEAVGADHPTGLQAALERSAEEDLLTDAVVAKSVAEEGRFWRLRHSISEAQKREGAGLKHDVSVPVGRVAQFIALGTRDVVGAIPGSRVVAFGHVGDGNVHFNVCQPETVDAQSFLAKREAVATIVYDTVTGLGGSISAEHGVGVLKREALVRYRSDIEVTLMKAVKQAIDPDNLMNPGKVL
ncbi:MAG: FAD-binding oxidoreductase [Pseudomonadota bacterium]